MTHEEHYLYRDHGSLEFTKSTYHSDNYNIPYQAELPQMKGQSDKFLSWACCFKSKMKYSSNDVSYRGDWTSQTKSVQMSYNRPIIELKRISGQHREFPADTTYSSKPQQRRNYHSRPVKNVAPIGYRKNNERVKRQVNLVDEVLEKKVCWEALLSDGWCPYAPAITQEIEKIYHRTRSRDLEVLEEKTWWQNESFFYRFNQYKISPHFMIQRNMNTGMDTKIRRKKVKQSSWANNGRATYSRRVKGSSRDKPSLYASSPKKKISSRGSQPNQGIRKRRNHLEKRMYADSDVKLERWKYNDNYYGKNTEAWNGTLDFSNYKNWGTGHVVDWLRILNFPQYCEIVQEKGVTGRELSSAGITYLVTQLRMTVEHATHIFGALGGIKSGFMGQKESAPRNWKPNNFNRMGDSQMTHDTRELKLSFQDSSSGDENVGESRAIEWENHNEMFSLPYQISETPLFKKSKKYIATNSENRMNDSQFTYNSAHNIHKRWQSLEEISSLSESEKPMKKNPDVSEDNLYRRETFLEDNEKGLDFKINHDEVRNNIERLKMIDWHNYKPSIHKVEKIETILSAKDSSISSENLTQQIHDSSSMSFSEKDISYQKPLDELSQENRISEKENLDGEFALAQASMESPEHERSNQQSRERKLDISGRSLSEEDSANISIRDGLVLTSMQLKHVEIQSDNYLYTEEKVTDEQKKAGYQVAIEITAEELRNEVSESSDEDRKEFIFSLKTDFAISESTAKTDDRTSITEDYT